MRRPSVSRVREIRTHGLKGGLRKRGRSAATAPEAYQCALCQLQLTLVWCQGRGNGQFLELHYETAVQATGIVVYET